MGAEIKIKLLELGKKQVDLLAEIRKRGYPNLAAPTLSRYINGVDITPQSEAVKSIISDIICEWENKA